MDLCASSLANGSAIGVRWRKVERTFGTIELSETTARLLREPFLAGEAHSDRILYFGLE